MRFRLRAFGLPALVCAGVLSVTPVASAASAAGATVKAAATVKAPPPGAVGVRPTSIMGAAWRSDNSPIPAAKIRLRNVITARIEGTAIANDLGQFSFNEIDGGSYVIELVSDGGKILADRSHVHRRARGDGRHVRAAAP